MGDCHLKIILPQRHDQPHVSQQVKPFKLGFDFLQALFLLPDAFVQMLIQWTWWVKCKRKVGKYFPRPVKIR